MNGTKPSLTDCSAPFPAAGSTGRITTAGATTSSGWRGAFLRDELVPVLDRFLSPDLDRHSFDRYQLMKDHYPQLAAGPDAPALPPDRPGGLNRDRLNRDRLNRRARGRGAPPRPRRPSPDRGAG